MVDILDKSQTLDLLNSYDSIIYNFTKFSNNPDLLNLTLTDMQYLYVKCYIEDIHPKRNGNIFKLYLTVNQQPPLWIYLEMIRVHVWNGITESYKIIDGPIFMAGKIFITNTLHLLEDQLIQSGYNNKVLKWRMSKCAFCCRCKTSIMITKKKYKCENCNWTCIRHLPPIPHPMYMYEDECLKQEYYICKYVSDIIVTDKTDGNIDDTTIYPRFGSLDLKIAVTKADLQRVIYVQYLHSAHGISRSVYDTLFYISHVVTDEHIKIRLILFVHTDVTSGFIFIDVD